MEGNVFGQKGAKLLMNSLKHERISKKLQYNSNP